MIILFLYGQITEHMNKKRDTYDRPTRDYSIINPYNPLPTISPHSLDLDRRGQLLRVKLGLGLLQSLGSL